MTYKFESLPLEKRLTIINASIAVFSESGYDKASTNEIVKRAGISKGLLFHYFSSKKKLYLYLYDYCMQYVIDAFYEELNLNETDFFEILKASTSIKMAIHQVHPQIFLFIQQAYYEPLPEFESEIYKKSLATIAEHSYRMFSGIDRSLFKAELDVDLCIKTLIWSMEGFIQERVQQAKSLKQALNYEQTALESEIYLDFFKKTYYKAQ